MKFIVSISKLYTFNRIASGLRNGITDRRVKIHSLLLHYQT